MTTPAATPARIVPAVVHPQSPALAVCSIGPGEGQESCGHDYFFIFAFRFPNVVMRRDDLRFIQAGYRIGMQRPMTKPPVHRPPAPRKRLPKSFKELTPARPFQPAHLFPRTGLESAAHPPHRPAQAAGLSQAQARAGGDHLDRARLVPDPVHRLERAGGSELCELALPAEAHQARRPENRGSAAD